MILGISSKAFGMLGAVSMVIAMVTKRVMTALKVTALLH